MKKMVWVILLVMVISLFAVARPAVAQPTEPLDVRRAVGGQLLFWGEFFKRIVLYGKPCVVFSAETHLGVETTFAERILTNKVDLIGGFTLANEERGKFFMGLQYNGFRQLGQPAGIWKIFETLRPTIYLVEGDWFFGAGYKFLN